MVQNLMKLCKYLTFLSCSFSLIFLFYNSSNNKNKNDNNFVPNNDLHLNLNQNSLTEEVGRNEEKEIENFKIPCNNYIARTFRYFHGNYWILANYFKGEEIYNCDESVTFCTIGDFDHLDNLEIILERWEGPISLSIYAPGHDFQKNVREFLFLRDCGLKGDLVKKYVSVHFFFDSGHLPLEIPDPNTLSVNCDKKMEEDLNDDVLWGAYEFTNSTVTLDLTDSYRNQNKLSFPINLARNIARDNAMTHFVFVLDIELYPTRNFIPKFLKMMRKLYKDKGRVKVGLVLNLEKTVYVLPVFEVVKEIPKIPENKKELVTALKEKQAFSFHQFYCNMCHKIPKFVEWKANISKTEEDSDLEIPKNDKNEPFHIFTVSKRKKAQKMWEPFFVSTKFEPYFDERFTWEGQKNKMSQGLIMCIMDYDYAVLDQAFLVHKPGVKTVKDPKERKRAFSKESRLFITKIKKVILPEHKIIFGNGAGCAI